jgi:predicted nucleic acid-binding protein
MPWATSKRETRSGSRSQAQLDASGDRDLRITAVTAYEMVRGALDLIDQRKRQRRDIIPAFDLLQHLVEYLGRWRGLILPYEARAEAVYRGCSARLRQDLKDDARIAAIALTHGAAVWTCNTTDYAPVPGLTVFQAETGTRLP